MASPHEHIVDFLTPPVAEVALAVQLQGQPFDTATTLGTFWPVVSEQYPRIEPQQPVPPMEERFDIPSQATIAFVLGGLDMQRWFLISEDERELIQVQHDRFGYNWRKERSDVEYPRYGYVRQRFEEAITAYLQTVRQQDREVGIAWCEITYVNPVFEVEGMPRPDLSTLVTRVAPQQLSMLPQPFNTGLRESFQLERGGEPYARFYIEVESTVQRPGQRLGYTITLTMRGRPESPDLAGALGFFDQGREKIVTTFREITTPARHKEWGLQL